MTKLSGSVVLRPTRIGFLVKPGDKESISKIMRLSTCLWGGKQNPIIPVGRFPKHWKSANNFDKRTSKQISRDYLNFFEPDVLVEAENGLAESIGLNFKKNDYESLLIDLDRFYDTSDDFDSGFKVGLSIIDAYHEIYDKKRQFVLRDKDAALIFNETSHSAIVEAVFGAFPKDSNTRHFLESYVNVYKPQARNLSPGDWERAFHAGEAFPFSPTFLNLDISSQSGNRFCFFVFDHTKPSDLIEYWNTRLYWNRVYPIPLCWIKELSVKMREIIVFSYKPIPKNPSGIKYNTNIVFSRSISSNHITELVSQNLHSCPKGSFVYSHSEHPKLRTHSYGPHCERNLVEAESASIDIEVQTDSNKTIKFDSISPNFAERYGSGHYRWVNVVKLSSYENHSLALTYPDNLNARQFPRLNTSLRERPVISREGWALGKKSLNFPNYLNLETGSEAICGWLKLKGYSAKVSSAGKIAEQLIESLGGLSKTKLIADVETIKLLNKMATQEVTQGPVGQNVQRQFEGRTVVSGRWEQLLKKRNYGFWNISPDGFAKKGILKLGLGVQCPNCTFNNWYGLDTLNYSPKCERCLKTYNLPQGSPLPKWKYRVTGPFSVPNYAEGSYCVALTLEFFRSKLCSSSDVGMTYTTGLDLETGEKQPQEVDLAFWHDIKRMYGMNGKPNFVVGECKSFGGEAFTKKDIDVLKAVASRIPYTTLVLSAMKDTFSIKEKELFSSLVKWGWKKIDGKMRAPVIILSGNELFSNHHVTSNWKELGPPYSNFSDLLSFRTLEEFAIVTQRIYLELDYYNEF